MKKNKDKWFSDEQLEKIKEITKTNQCDDFLDKLQSRINSLEYESVLDYMKNLIKLATKNKIFSDTEASFDRFGFEEDLISAGDNYYRSFKEEPKAKPRILELAYKGIIENAENASNEREIIADFKDALKIL